MMWATLKQHNWEWRGVFSVAPTIAGIAIASPSLRQEQGQVGFNNFVVDTDGKLRRGFSTTAELQDKFSTQQIGYVRLTGRERGIVVYEVLRSPTINKNPESTISVNIAITLAEQRSLSRNLREDSFSTTDYHPSSLTEF